MHNLYLCYYYLAMHSFTARIQTFIHVIIVHIISFQISTLQKRKETACFSILHYILHFDISKKKAITIERYAQ